MASHYLLSSDESEDERKRIKTKGWFKPVARRFSNNPSVAVAASLCMQEQNFSCVPKYMC
jgi:hypothetical protein